MKFKLIATAAADKEAIYPPKVVDFNKLPNKDGFWNWTIEEAQKAAGLRPLKADGRIDNLLFWLNMAATAWERLQTSKKK